jgi:prepilin peptidase CpaA
MTNPFVVLAILVFAYTATAMITDLRARRIPNWLTVSSLVGALLFHGVTGGWSGLGHALGGFAVGFGFLLVLWLIGGAGGGDVKLTGALGAWLGASTTLLVLLISTPLALFMTIAFTAWKKIQNTSKDQESQPSMMRRGVPYAVPIALSCWSILILKLLAP